MLVSAKSIQLIILDRDGVINFDSKEYIKSPSEWDPIPGSIEAIARLKKNGFRVAIASNQSGITREYFSLETLAAIHSKMNNMLRAVGGEIDVLRFCPHHPNDHCNCRKPQSGMLLDIMATLKIKKENTIMIGDSVKDIYAAINAGCHSAIVKTGNGTNTSSKLSNVTSFNNLAEFVEQFLS